MIQVSDMSDKTRRHCMVVHASYPIGEVRVQREAEALIDHGYIVDIICLRLPGELAVDSYHGVNIYRLPVRRHKGSGALVQLLEYLMFFTLAFLKLAALHLRWQYAVVQVHNLPDFLIFAALFPKLTGCPIILDLHDLMPEFFASRFNVSRSSLPLRLVYLQEQLACRFADHVITVTEHWRQSLIQRGVPAGKCSVLMNLADTRIFKKPVRTQPKPHDNDRFQLVYHGAIPRRYGLDLVVQAIARVRAEIPGIHFTVIGRGEYLDELVRLTTELGLEAHVRFEKFMPVEDLPARIVTADLAVVPYRNDVFTNELLPTKLLEYAALGVPTIASRTVGISAYFDETMVQFFTPGDVDELAQCILKLYRNRSRLVALARSITRFDERFNWPDQRTSYLQLVDRLIERSQCPTLCDSEERLR
jgi:glycosyltransferase involved in cell wall biosynthesis